MSVAVRAGINGFGRIGRCVLRALAESKRDDIDIVAINSRADVQIAAHLLKYDSTHGRFEGDVRAEDGLIIAGNRRIPYTRAAEPAEAGWGSAGVDMVLECSGAFNSRDAAAMHLRAGARRALVSAPARGADATVVFGVNHGVLKEDSGLEVVSAASCTTNCLAPVAKVLDDHFGVVSGMMSTAHAVTGDQRLLDESHADLRRARAAGISIIPTKTGAAAAIGEVLPQLAGKLDGGALRVPVADVSLLELTCILERPADVGGINDAFRGATQEFPPGVLAVSEEPLVSADFIHAPHSAAVDLTQTRAQGNLARVSAWYDNEWGFALRMLDVAAFWDA